MPAAVSENALGTLFGAAQRTADAVRGAKSVDRFRAAQTDDRKAALRRSGMKVRAGKAGSSRGTARRREGLSGRNHRLTGPPRRQRDAGRGTPVLRHLRAREWQNGKGRQQLPELAGPGAARRCQGRSAPKQPPGKAVAQLDRTEGRRVWGWQQCRPHLRLGCRLKNSPVRPPLSPHTPPALSLSKGCPCSGDVTGRQNQKQPFGKLRAGGFAVRSWLSCDPPNPTICYNFHLPHTSPPAIFGANAPPSAHGRV